MQNLRVFSAMSQDQDLQKSLFFLLVENLMRLLQRERKLSLVRAALSVTGQGLFFLRSL